MTVQEGIFCSYIRAFPQERDRMFEAIAYVVDQGIGGAILDNLTSKTFRDTGSEYLIRVKKEALKREDGILILFQALLSWYETWKDSYKDFNSKNAMSKFNKKPIHTWLHCLLTGQQHIYQTLADHEMVLVSKSEWEETRRKAEKVGKSMSSNLKEEVPIEHKERITRLFKLYENDIEIRLKELLLDKKIAIFLENKWNDEQLEEMVKKYHLLSIKQFPSIELTADPGIFDYYLFLTSQASHSAFNKLDKNISRDKLFLIRSNNKDVVMEDFLKQLRGKC